MTREELEALHPEELVALAVAKGLPTSDSAGPLDHDDLVAALLGADQTDEAIPDSDEPEEKDEL